MKYFSYLEAMEGEAKLDTVVPVIVNTFTALRVVLVTSATFVVVEYLMLCRRCISKE